MAEGSRAPRRGGFRAEPAAAATPGQSVGLHIVIVAVLAALALALGLSGADSLLHARAQLYLSTATVKAAVSRILSKLGLASRTQIAVVVRNSPGRR
jgi:hypothetical protein